jgi:hypothetical protein
VPLTVWNRLERRVSVSAMVIDRAFAVGVIAAVVACGERPEAPVLASSRRPLELFVTQRPCALDEEAARRVTCPPGAEREGIETASTRALFCVVRGERNGPAAEWPTDERLPLTVRPAPQRTQAGEHKAGRRVGYWTTFEDGAPRSATFHAFGRELHRLGCGPGQ